jgi:hypothetical protein
MKKDLTGNRHDPRLVCHALGRSGPKIPRLSHSAYQLLPVDRFSKERNCSRFDGQALQIAVRVVLARNENHWGARFPREFSMKFPSAHARQAKVNNQAANGFADTDTEQILR